MKRTLCYGFCFFLAMLFPLCLMAADYVAEADLMTTILKTEPMSFWLS